MAVQLTLTHCKNIKLRACSHRQTQANCSCLLVSSERFLSERIFDRVLIATYSTFVTKKTACVQKELDIRKAAARKLIAVDCKEKLECNYE